MNNDHEHRIRRPTKNIWLAIRACSPQTEFERITIKAPKAQNNEMNRAEYRTCHIGILYM